MPRAGPGIDTEICVVGGGPAGAMVARRLAELGHDTLLIDRTAEVRPLRAESLAPSILAILDSIDLRSIVDAAVFLREKRALLLWESRAVEEKSLADAPSALIDRALFDKVLREAAHRSGARLLAPAAARPPQRLRSGDWLVPVTTSTGPALIKTKFLVDARGKRRHALEHGAPRTAAISAAWALGSQSFSETRIEAGRDEWYWGNPLPGGDYAVTIFLDSFRLAGLTGPGRTALYRSLIARSKLLGDVLRGKLINPPSVRDATSGINKELIGRDFIRVGEAALAIDPLSSQGIQTALLGAVQASAAIHTLLAHKHDASPAIEFYRERQQTAAARARHNATRLYGAANRAGRGSFWNLRSLLPEPARAHAQYQPASALRLPCPLGLSRELKIVSVPLLSDAFISRGRALSHPALDHPVGYLGNIALVPLIEEAAAVSTANQILSRWTKRMPAQTAWNILQWMHAVGILVPEASDARQHVDPLRP